VACLDKALHRDWLVTRIQGQWAVDDCQPPVSRRGLYRLPAGGLALRHSFGTSIFHVSRSVHAVGQDSMLKNQQLNSLIFLGWKQAGFDSITKNT
jgi:hypothetical protein